MSARFSARFVMSTPAADQGGGVWRVIGEVWDDSGMTYLATDVELGDVIFDLNLYANSYRWKITNIVSAVLRDLTCDVVFDDEGVPASAPYDRPQMGVNAICSVTGTNRLATVPTRTYAKISEKIYTQIRNIDGSAKVDPLLGSLEYEDMEFVEGTDAPDVTDMDTFGFDDAAAFDPGVDRDVIFRATAVREDLKEGFEVVLIYAMSTSFAGDVQLKLDWHVHDEGEQVDGGTAYDDTQVKTVNATGSELAILIPFTIPSGQITDTTREIEFRLTREGSSVSDTHTGEFGLKNIMLKTI